MVTFYPKINCVGVSLENCFFTIYLKRVKLQKQIIYFKCNLITIFLLKSGVTVSTQVGLTIQLDYAVAHLSHSYAWWLENQPKNLILPWTITVRSPLLRAWGPFDQVFCRSKGQEYPACLKLVQTFHQLLDSQTQPGTKLAHPQLFAHLGSLMISCG